MKKRKCTTNTLHKLWRDSVYMTIQYVCVECVCVYLCVCVPTYVLSVFSVFRPEVCESRHQIMIRDGRHPAIDLLMGEHNQYVPNLTELQVRTQTHTGPFRVL